MFTFQGKLFKFLSLAFCMFSSFFYKRYPGWLDAWRVLFRDSSATIATTSVFPLLRCIVSSSSHFRALRRKLRNTNICSSCLPDILMRLRPTYATQGIVFRAAATSRSALTRTWFLCSRYFLPFSSFLFLIWVFVA